MLVFESPKLDLYNSSYGPFSGTAPSCPVLAEPTIQVFGTDFWLGKVRLWTRILQETCSYIRELNVRIFNHLNRTSINQVMVRFPGPLELRLFNDLCPDFCHNWYMIVVYHRLN